MRESAIRYPICEMSRAQFRAEAFLRGEGGRRRGEGGFISRRFDPIFSFQKFIRRSRSEQARER